MVKSSLAALTSMASFLASYQACEHPFNFPAPILARAVRQRMHAADTGAVQHRPDAVSDTPGNTVVVGEMLVQY